MRGSILFVELGIDATNDDILDQMRKMKSCREDRSYSNIVCTVGHKRQAVENHLKLNCNDLPGIAEATLARVLGNCFKHSGGLVSDNPEALKVVGGKAGDVINYEKYDWRTIIERVGEFLHALTSKL